MNAKKTNAKMSSGMMWAVVGIGIVVVLIVAYILGGSSGIKTQVIEPTSTPARTVGQLPVVGIVTPAQATLLRDLPVPSAVPTATSLAQAVGPISLPVQVCFCRCAVPLGINLCTIPEVAGACISTTFLGSVGINETCNP
ncbi:hypothetical protein IH781_00155, partial [Patescibacteria group bacterium]|nr:hypothetical protein [Patescibacteria group bacterium]